MKNDQYGFEFLGEGDYVIDQLPRVGEQIEEGQKVKLCWVINKRSVNQ